jgi:hypothetical protein
MVPEFAKISGLLNSVRPVPGKGVFMTIYVQPSFKGQDGTWKNKGDPIYFSTFLREQHEAYPLVAAVPVDEKFKVTKRTKIFLRDSLQFSIKKDGQYTNYPLDLAPWSKVYLDDPPADDSRPRPQQEDESDVRRDIGPGPESKERF